MNRVISFWKEDSGASAAEYALLLGIVGAAIAVAAVGLGEAIANSIQNTADCINDCTP